jgi:hypothetical protein
MPRNLANKATSIVGLGLIAAINVLFATSVSAEFFGCNDRPGRVLATYTSNHGGRTTHEFAAQSARTRFAPPRTTYVGSRRYWSDRSRW